MTGALDVLLGDCAVERFLSDCWERQPWRGRSPAVTSLLGARDVEEYVALGRMGVEAIRVFRDTEQVPAEDYTMSDGRGSAVLRPERLVELFAGGATLVLEAVHLRFPAIAELCAALADELGQPTQANAYYTPAGGSAFPLHHDTHDVFVVQVAGSKAWEVRRPVIELPLPTQRFDREGMEPGELVWSGQINAGDVMYLPRGWLHQAGAQEAPSLHLTVGVLVRTWHDELIAAVKEVAASRVELRTAVSSGGPAQALRALEEALRPAEVERRRREQRRGGSNPPVPRRFDDLRGGSLTATTLLRRRREVPMSVASVNGRVALELPEKTVRFPVRAAAALDFIAARDEPFTAEEVPGGLVVAERLVVLRRLLVEGAVTRAASDAVARRV